MSALFLIRNLLSVKTALAISQRYKSQEKPVFSVETGLDDYCQTIKQTVPQSITTIQTLNVDWLFQGVRYLYSLKALIRVERELEALFNSLDVNELFVHYPLHEKDALYVKIARKLGIPVSFYEEGACFYTGSRGRDKSIFKEIKYWVKHFSLKALKIHRGYHAKADFWYSMLPLADKSCMPINIEYTKVTDIDIKYLFLSRPVSLDYPDITIEQHAQAMYFFLHAIPANENIYIKFHPRETREMRDHLLNLLINFELPITVIEFSVNCPAEDLVFSMPEGVVCGFDSSTLIYGKSINQNVHFCSVLKHVYKLDSSTELKNLYDCYRTSFPHIEFI